MKTRDLVEKIKFTFDEKAVIEKYRLYLVLGSLEDKLFQTHLSIEEIQLIVKLLEVELVQVHDQYRVMWMLLGPSKTRLNGVLDVARQLHENLQKGKI